MNDPSEFDANEFDFSTSESHSASPAFDAEAARRLEREARASRAADSSPPATDVGLFDVLQFVVDVTIEGLRLSGEGLSRAGDATSYVGDTLSSLGEIDLSGFIDFS